MQTKELSKTKEPAPIFKNKVLEALTYTNFSIHIIWYLSLAILSMILGFIENSVNVFSGLGIFIFGLFLWTLVEYIMHRFVFHYISKNEYIKRFHYIFHGIHHQFPREEKRTMMPPAGGLIYVTLYFAFGYLVMGNLSFFLTAGLTLGYLIYSGFHYSIHMFKAPKRLEFLWTHHLLHHYQEPERAFGVSTRLWDKLFGTMPTKQKN